MGAPRKPGGNAGKGRPRGSPNKATAALREIAGQYTEQAVAALVAVLSDPKAPPAARVSAAVAILDRGHGKPGQAVEMTVQQRPFDELSDEELMAIIDSGKAD